MPGKGKPSLAAAESLSASEMVTLMKLGFLRNALLEVLLDLSGLGARSIVPSIRSALEPGSEKGESSRLSLGVVTAPGLEFFSSLVFRPGKGNENLKVRGMSDVDQAAEIFLWSLSNACSIRERF